MTSHASDLAKGRLSARVPEDAPDRAPTPGLYGLADAGASVGLLMVPPALPSRPPVVLALHGAGGSGRQMIDLLGPAAERDGIVLVAPDSRAATWDVIRGGYGPDVAVIDSALAQVFATTGADPDRVAIGGFSDGASYALSLGLVNGDLFAAVLAYSPGFAVPGVRHGTPRVFISHGTQDAVLPIDRCSRRIVPALCREGYDVQYVEFPGAHRVPPEMVDSSFQLLVGERRPRTHPQA